MSEGPPRRSKSPKAPEPLTGYRQTRRGSRASKSAKRAEKKYSVAAVVDRWGRSLRNFVIVAVRGLGTFGMVILVLLLLATGVNTYARWSALKSAREVDSSQERERRSKENLLVIGVDEGKAIGFLAMRVDRAGSRVFGIAIPDGAFIDIPGQGFERVGEAYDAGADVALSAISNYLTVPFVSYITVPKAAYSDALSRQVVASLPKSVGDSNLSTSEMEILSKDLSVIEQKNVALVPLPVKPIKLGDQTYFEPQRAEVADLLKSWWGVSASDQRRAVRVIVYNGAGVPGVAGEAAQVLIRAGFRVVDTKNADEFNYAKTRVVVRQGDATRGESVKRALGVGVVTVEPSSSEVTDVIVIIGKDYQTPEAPSKGTK